MGKRELKEQNKDLEIHVVDLINRFDPSDSGKYTKFLIKILKDKLIERQSYERKGRLRTLNIADRGEFTMPKGTNYLEDVLISYITEEVYGRENIETLISFHKHVKENRIVGKDVNNYTDWDQLTRDVSLASLKQNQKMLEKEVQKVVETDEWLVVRPLTMESSLTYGSGTKWCTAMRNNRDYFYRYSRNGVLCYAISKVDGDKFGLYYDMENNEFSIWNAPDRRIDSIESTIPSDLMDKLYKFMKTEKRNYEYFSDSEKEKCDEYYQLSKAEEPMVEEAQVVPMEMPDYDYSDEQVVDTDIDVEHERPNIYLEEARINYENHPQINRA